MIDRPMDVWGAPLEVEVLLYASLRCCAQLMELGRRNQNSRLLDQRLVLTRQWIHDLRKFLLKHYWVTSKTMQVLRRRPTEQYGDNQHQNEFNVQPQVIPDWLQDWLENRGGYLHRQHPYRPARFSVFTVWAILWAACSDFSQHHNSEHCFGSHFTTAII